MALTSCFECKKEVSNLAKACPHCGAPVSAPMPSAVVTPAEKTNSAVVKSEKEFNRPGFEGGCYGVLMWFHAFGCGTVLCMTGIGAILGIPLIIFAFFAPFAGFMGAFLSLEGKCPWCGQIITIGANEKGVDCSTCKKRVIIKDKRFFKAE